MFDKCDRLTFEDKMFICKGCGQYCGCVQPFNDECGVFKSILKDILKSSEKEKLNISKENVIQFPVDMDEMQRNILVELLNARQECTDQNLLTARGCVAIIDALFYLVKEKPIWTGIDMGDPNGDRTGGLD